MLIFAGFAAASMWFYVTRILVPYQLADAAIHDRPRGNLSDLYPRWLGARELLLHHRNPYSQEVTKEIQQGFYGRVLDPARRTDPIDQQGFAYPVYVVFLLAPGIGLPFSLLQSAFYWFLAGLTATSVWLWLRAIRWRLPPAGLAAGMLFTLGSFSAVQGIKLQQLSLLVAALLAASVAATVNGRLFLGGALLALSTIKPQLTWPLAAWLLAWAVWDWRGRRRFVFGFALTMGALLAGGDLILPGWWSMFAAAIAQYRQYTHSQSVVEVLLNQVAGPATSGIARTAAQIIAAVAVLVSGWWLAKLRFTQAGSAGFSSALALALALTVLGVPMYAPYNQLLLLPAILVLARDRTFFESRSYAYRFTYMLGILAVSWQWIASSSLSAIYFLGDHTWALSRWRWPFFATFALPVLIFVLIFLEMRKYAAPHSAVADDMANPPPQAVAL